MTLRVYNYARVDPASLAGSEKVADAIFGNVGIRLVWVDCPGSDAELAAYPTCQSKMGTADLVLKILPSRMTAKLQTRKESLGFAQPCPQTASACEVTIFYDRVDKLAASGYRAERILGYVVAHEMAHLLIGPGHSEEGIMRSEWTPFDLQRISWGLHMDFTREQSRRLLASVVQRTMLDGPPQKAGF